MEATNKEGEPMRRVFFTLAILAFSAFAGNVWIEPGPAGGSTDADYLQYDDGSPSWLTWAGTYRGVWFNTEDFVPGYGGFGLDFSEYWMYHHSSYPWDVSDFYAEVWNGDYMGPLVSLDVTQITALHYAPVFANYSPQLEAESSFWSLEDTEMSAGGWPAMMGDATPPTVDHSYYSDDFFVWEPWSDGVNTGDLLTRVEGDFLNPGVLSNATWGAIKTTF
jgi:hypothetical protein